MTTTLDLSTGCHLRHTNCSKTSRGIVRRCGSERQVGAAREGEKYNKVNSGKHVQLMNEQTVKYLRIKP